MHSGLQAKQKILETLRDGELSVRKLARRVGTGTRTIHFHLDELAAFACVEIIEHATHPRNGRPYSTVRLTPEGYRTLRRLTP